MLMLGYAMLCYAMLVLPANPPPQPSQTSAEGDAVCAAALSRQARDPLKLIHNGDNWAERGENFRTHPCPPKIANIKNLQRVCY